MSALGDLQWMLPPLAICLVLTGIHGYLGIHVISRKVIFVDLALAQIAALGSVGAVLLGYDERLATDQPAIYLFSLGFTLVGAAVFSVSRMRHEKVPQEAFIGIVYAVASALAILLLARSPGEGEHIKEMLVGNVLLVTWPTVVRTALIYSAIGVIHFLLRRPFLEISADPAAAAARGRRVVLWDFAFYATFGLVITSSVAVAGVLLVFSFLVVPAVIAFMWAQSLRVRIGVAWAVGTACSAVGMLLSYYGDLPTGPSVVACFAGLLILSSVLHYVLGAERRAQALVRVGAGAAVVLGLLALAPLARKAPAQHAHESDYEKATAALASSDEAAQIDAIHHLTESKDPHAVPLLVRALDSASDRLMEHILTALPSFGAAAEQAVPALVSLARSNPDPFLRIQAAETLLRLHDPAGFEVLRAVLADDAPLLAEQKVGALLAQAAGQNFGVGTSDAAQDRQHARTAFETWLREKGDNLRWRPDLRRFE